MNPKLKELVDAVREPLAAAIRALAEAHSVRFKTVDSTVKALREEYAQLKTRYDDHVAKAVSIEKVAENIRAAFHERDANIIRDCTELAVGFSRRFCEEQFSEIKESLQASITTVKTLIPVLPAPIDLDALALTAASLVKPPENGKDGTSPTAEELDNLVRAVVSKVELPSAESVAASMLPALTSSIENKGATIETKCQQAIAEFIEGAVKNLKVIELAPEQLQAVIEKVSAKIQVPKVEDILPVITERVIQLSSTWELEFERRAQDRFLRIVEQLPKPRDGINGKDGINGIDGKDGKNGVSADNWKVTVLDDGRTLRNEFTVNGETVVHEVKTGLVVYRGYYKDKDRYEPGDAVTFGGSLFIALKETQSKPETDETWRLAVKRGRNGINGERGKQGEPGEIKTVRHVEVNPLTLGTRGG